MSGYSSPHLDDLDYQILDILIKDSRTPYLEVARVCNVSGGTIHVRMKKMEELGVIKGTRLIVDYSKLGYDVCCFVGVYLERTDTYENIYELLSEIPEILEVHSLTGEYSILIKIVCKSISDLQNVLIKKIHKIPTIQRTDTFVSLFQPIDRNLEF